MKIAIIGAGLAGLSCFNNLKRYASDIKIYEAGDGLAPAASGNSVGSVNPRFTAFRNEQSDFYTSAYAGAVKFFEGCSEEVNWQKCGALHLITDEKKQTRFEQTVQNWSWPEEYMQIVNAAEASEIAGVTIQHDALYLPFSGYLSPAKLCAYYARGADIEFGARIKSIKDLDADIIILSCGQGMRDFAPWLKTGHVRGQITRAKASGYSADLKCNVHYGGYCTPAIDGIHTIGASFQRWLDHSDLIDQDDQDNIDKLAAVLPSVAMNLKPDGARASVRTTSPDHFPIIGRHPEFENVYISTGHGSHGIVSSFAGAQLITDLIMGHPRSQTKETIEALAPQRFFK